MYLLTRFISNILSSEENFITQTNKVRYSYETIWGMNVIKLSTIGTSSITYHVNEDWINFGYFNEDNFWENVRYDIKNSKRVENLYR